MVRSDLHVKKKDVVQVMSGREKGKTGKILKVDRKHGRVTIEKLNMVKRHTKANPGNAKQPSGIVEKEAPLFAAIVLLYCDKCSRGVRTKAVQLEGGKKVRACKKCNTQLDK